MVRGGADLIELGVPFCDPIADGPVIQRGGERALKAGTTLATVLEIARRFAATPKFRCCCSPTSIPVRYGLDAWRVDAAASGIDGCLLIDACVEEADVRGAMHRHGLDTVFLAAPTSTERRIKLVARILHGFRLSGFAHRCHRRTGFSLGSVAPAG